MGLCAGPTFIQIRSTELGELRRPGGGKVLIEEKDICKTGSEGLLRDVGWKSYAVHVMGLSAGQRGGW